MAVLVAARSRGPGGPAGRSRGRRARAGDSKERPSKPRVGENSTDMIRLVRLELSYSAKRLDD